MIPEVFHSGHLIGKETKWDGNLYRKLLTPSKKGKRDGNSDFYPQALNYFKSFTCSRGLKKKSNQCLNLFITLDIVNNVKSYTLYVMNSELSLLLILSRL